MEWIVCTPWDPTQPIEPRLRQERLRCITRAMLQRHGRTAGYQACTGRFGTEHTTGRDRGNPHTSWKEPRSW